MKTILRMILIVTVCASAASAQGIWDKVKEKVKDKTNNSTQIQANTASYSHFARFEVQFSWKEKGDWKYKTRVYYSNMIELTAEQAQDRENKTNLIQYFNDGIVAPLEKQGFQVSYYTSDVKIYPLSAAYASRKEAEDDMQKRIEVDKSNEREIYTFIWKYNGSLKEAAQTTQPKLLEQ